MTFVDPTAPIPPLSDKEKEIFAVLEAALRRGELSRNDMAFIRKARVKAYQVHEGQLRKSGEPYIVHPIVVVHVIVITYGILDPLTIALAYLHDAVEDQMRRMMPDYDTDPVGAVARLEAEYDPILIRDLRVITRAIWQRDKSAYIADIAARGSFRALIVKLEDRVHNIETLEYLEPHKQRREALATMECFPDIVAALLAKPEAAPCRAIIEQRWDEVVELCQAYLV
jgi:GTP diphosphokinase / guanosine-3',5'-bis(diphosphate) 3'-diphosphatase